MTHHLVVSKNSLQTSPKTPPQKSTHSKKKSNNPFEDDFLNFLHPNLALLDASHSPAANCPNQPTNQPTPTPTLDSWPVPLELVLELEPKHLNHGKMWCGWIPPTDQAPRMDFFSPKKTSLPIGTTMGGMFCMTFF